MSNTNSPLQSKDQIKSSNINLEYMDFIGKINLRIRDADTDVLNKVSAYLGYELPQKSMLHEKYPPLNIHHLKMHR